MSGYSHLSLQTVTGCNSGQQKLLHVLVANWMKIFRHRKPEALLFFCFFPLFPPSSFPLFFYLMSLANGNFLGRTAVEGIVVVTKRNGENPCVRTSVFFLSIPFYYCLLPSRFSWWEEKKREMKEKEWGKSVNPASLLVFPSQTGPVWSFAVWGVKSV